MRRSLALVLLLASPALGQAPPTPPDPRPAPSPVASITVPEGVPLVVFGDDSVSSKKLKWKLKSPKVAFEVADLPGHPGGVFIIRSPMPGVVYKLALVADVEGETDFDFADVVVGVAPKPAPAPTPGPPDPPAPAPPAPNPPVVLGDGWHATLVVNGLASRQELLAIAAVADSRALGPAVKSMGGTWHKLDANSAEYVRSNLDKFLPLEDATGAKVATPALVIQDATGKVLRKAPAPADEASILKYLSDLKGGR